MSTSSFRRVFVIGAYLPNGGTVMAYHLGRILERDFGIRAFAVTLGDETADAGIYHYDLRMPAVPLAEMERQITASDILIVNPSFSSQQFGSRLPGFKICYVQGFSTYALLDLKFDHYVAVSDFVGDFLRATYALDARVIPPFIDLDGLPQVPEWSQRPPSVVLPYRKGLAEVWDWSYQRLREILQQRAPQITLAEPLAASGLAHRQFLQRIGSVRYLLTLSAAEGFGLVPLEAMALGSVVIGYDGFGGRHYMRSGQNCAVAPYPEIEQVAELLMQTVASPGRSAELARAGGETAADYSYAAFRRAWIEEFSAALALAPTT